MLAKTLLQTQKLLKRMKTLRHIPDDYWSRKIVDLDLPLGNIEFDSQSQTLFFKPLDVVITKGKHEFLLNSKIFYQAKTLKNTFDAKFYLDHNNELIIDIDSLKIMIQTEQEVSIIHEIFWLGIYNLIYHRPMVILDIGMNTGFASLYFAAKENVQAVFGYEPFKMTYEQALQNFSLNPEIAEKIQAFDYGIGGEAQTLEIEYDYACKASIGIEGIAKEFKKNQSQSLVKEEIHIKPIGEILDTVTSQYPGVDIVAKIDCEGSEYDIFKALVEKGQLSLLKAIMMEWHQKGPDPLVDALRKEGFTIFSRLPKSKNIGMIYAVRP